MIRSFWTNRSGNYAVVLAVTALPLLLAVGLATDYSRHVAASRHLQELADAASLALAASEETDKKKLREMADDVVQGNRADSRLKNVKVVDIDAEDDWVEVDLSGDIPTTFMNLANIQQLDVRASAMAERAVTGSVEVALVLDNTASMATDDKIGTLREAATDLVDKLFDEEDADVRIGLVPYAEQINVGKHNRSASWLSVKDDYTTVKKHACYSETTTGGGCKKKAPSFSCTKTVDGFKVAATCSGACTEYHPTVTKKHDPICPPDTVTSFQWHGCIGSRVSGGKLVLDDQSPSVKYPGFVTKNKTCLTEVLPLTDDENVVKKAVKDMITARNTYIPAGVVWGVNVLSRTAPLEQGAEYDPANRKPRKVMVLMTDGMNSQRVVMSTGNYETPPEKDVEAERIKANADTMTACDYAKSQNIEIYSVAFKIDDAGAKSMLEYCATSAAHYYDASDPDKLLAAFSDIAESLRQVRLAR